MCVLGGIWLVLLLGISVGERFANPRLEGLVAFVCIGWFAYWSLSSLRSVWPKKDKPTEVKSTDTNEPPKSV